MDKQIKEIVNKYIKSGLNLNTRFFAKIEKTDKYEDEFRWGKDASTDFVNDEYIKTNRETLNLLQVAFRVIGGGLEYYKKKKKLNKNDIIFYYKGGNVMKLYFDNFRDLYIGEINELISKEYKKYFKKSDNDFSILVNPYQKNYNKIFNDVNNLTYLLLDKVRNIVVSNEKIFFEFPKLNNFEQQGKLRAFRDQVNKDNPKKFVEQITISKASDKFIFFDEQGNTVIDEILGKESKNIYISYNTALRFTKKKDYLIHFNLIRSKITFKYDIKKPEQETINIGGEHIDISIPIHDDSQMVSYQNNEKWNKIMNHHFYYGYNRENDFYYTVWNINYIINDLLNTIFVQKIEPWEDRKYEKRINRIFYFLLVDSIYKIIPNIDYKNVEKIKKDYKAVAKIFNKKAQLKQSDLHYKNDNLLKVYDRLYYTITYFKQKKAKIKEFNKIVNNNFKRLDDIFNKSIKVLKNYKIDKDQLYSLYKI